MPLKKGKKPRVDYQLSKDLVLKLDIGESTHEEVGKIKVVQKYLYELGLKCEPKRVFSTKKTSETSLYITRIK